MHLQTPPHPIVRPRASPTTLLLAEMVRPLLIMGLVSRAVLLATAQQLDTLLVSEEEQKLDEKELEDWENLQDLRGLEEIERLAKWVDTEFKDGQDEEKLEDEEWRPKTRGRWLADVDDDDTCGFAEEGEEEERLGGWWGGMDGDEMCVLFEEAGGLKVCLWS